MATVGQPDAMRRITVHYVNPPTRGTEEANFEGLDNDFLEFVIGDVLQDQESLYQSKLDDTNNNHARGARTTAPSDNSHYYYHGESSSSAATTSRTSNMDEQIASDFEYARQLQEMEDLTIETPPDEEDDISCVASPSDTDEDGDNEQEAARRDDDDHDDPDSMTYEQRQALVESVGSQDRGLSDQLISYLVPWKYKSGFFSRKTNHEDCPICLSTFRNRERLITLPCKHNYHAGCVAKWLKIDKTCPVCKYEVFGPS